MRDRHLRKLEESKGVDFCRYRRNRHWFWEVSEECPPPLDFVLRPGWEFGSRKKACAFVIAMPHKTERWRMEIAAHQASKASEVTAHPLPLSGPERKK